MAEYLQNGEVIFNKYCSSPDNQPIMLPRAPAQTYIDKYPDSDEPGCSSDFRDERQRQSDYEAEVKVYRALERLNDNLVVLHNFEFTHHQYRVCDDSHVRKGCPKCKGKKAENKEGECDFLIICQGLFVVIEVKNMVNVDRDVVECEPDFHLCTIGEESERPECTTREQQLRALNGTFKKSVQQRDKIESLIKSINKDTTVLQFTAYPNFSKQFKEQFQFSEKPESRLSDTELSTIIFKEDILGHNVIKDNYIRESRTSETSTEVTVASDEVELVTEENCFSRLFRCLAGCCYRTRDTADTDRNIFIADNSLHDEIPTDFDKISSSSDKDFSSFSDWWNINVTQAIISAKRTPDEPTTSTETSSYDPDCHQKVTNMLLAIWATEKNNCDQLKCSLGQCIMDTDRRLKEGLFTFESKKGKNRAQNPGVVKAPEVIRNYIEVQNLTTQQEQVFNSQENLLWINGPAGAGKTVVLCGKIIQLIQSDKDNKVVLFRFVGEGNNSQLYQRALDKANVQYQIITDKYEHTPSQLSNLISESVCRVVIVEITRYLDVTDLTDILRLVKDCNLFIDDVQRVLYHNTAERWSVLLDTLLELSSNNIIWLACDVVQCWSLYSTQAIINLANVITDKLQSNQWTTLSMNLRNTFDLTNILSVIRDQFIKLCSIRLDILNMILPAQIPGHFIHGPKIVIHFLNNFNVDIIGNVLNKELDKLCNTDTLSNSDIGIVYDNYSSDVVSLVTDTVNIRCDDNTDDKIAVCRSRYRYSASYSAEWPAVVVLRGMWGDSEVDLTTLYLMISRARVHCSVVMYPDEGATLEDKRLVLDLLDNLRDYAHIVRH